MASYVDDGFSGPAWTGLARRLRHGAEAGEIEVLWSLTPDRLGRSYAYRVSSPTSSPPTASPSATWTPPTSPPTPRPAADPGESVIAEYERAKVSERSRRGELYRARAGEAVHWRAPFGYVVSPPASGRRTWW